MQPWFTVYFFDIGHSCYDQLTPASITSADQYHVTKSRARVCKSSRSHVFWNWLLSKCWVSIGSRAHVRLTCWKQGRIVREPVKANPGLKVNRIINFSAIQMFFAAFFRVYGDYKNSKQKAKQHTENLTAKLQNSDQNSTFSWVSLIGLWRTRPRSYAFRRA